MVYQAYNLRDTAVSCYRNAARLEPDEFRWHYYLGHLHHDEGQEDDARVSLNRSLALRPGDVPAMLLLARIEFESNRLDRAESLYRSILAAAAENPGALFGVGKTAVARKDYAVAVEQLEHALRRAPQATEIHYPLGLAYRGLGDAERALEHLEQRGDVPPPQDDPLLGALVALAGGMRVHQLRGTALAQEGHYAEALTEFRRAVESDPDEPLVRTNLALTWIKFGDFSSARRELNAALALAPDDAFAHYNLGTLEAQLGRDERAVEHLERVSRVALLSTFVAPVDGVLRSALMRLPRIPGLGALLVQRLNLFVPLALRAGVVHWSRLTPELRRAYATPFPDAASRLPIRRWTEQLPASNRDRTYRVLQAIAGSLPSFDRPVLILRGRYDPVLTMSRARWLRETLPQARLEVVLGAGHFLQEDQPERVASLLVDFLTEGTRDSPPPRPGT